ncbi:MAG TPA: DUF1697 domain-containing protein [Candidatus Paceibacterota bacterium]|nr:DUF1697 domain-containing protein [Candidatus Paceibacterota bacterium]
MTTYVALLRGIGPGNPNMHQSKLKACFEKAGFTDVHPIINSGNVVFKSSEKNEVKLEAHIEAALTKHLGFTRAAIVRSEADLKKLVKKNPFKGVKDEKPNYLLVTFFKDRKKKELCTVIDLSGQKTPDFMVRLDKDHGKAVTSRTWKTVNRILTKMEAI